MQDEDLHVEKTDGGTRLNLGAGEARRCIDRNNDPERFKAMSENVSARQASRPNSRWSAAASAWMPVSPVVSRMLKCLALKGFLQFICAAYKINYRRVM